MLNNLNLGAKMIANPFDDINLCPGGIVGIDIIIANLAIIQKLKLLAGYHLFSKHANQIIIGHNVRHMLKEILIVPGKYGIIQ